MMQQIILDSYFRAFGKKPLRSIASDTGIKTSRVFRLLNGHEMKVSEYERFQTLIDKKNGKQKHLAKLLQDSQEYITESMATEIKELTERLVRRKQISLGMVI